MLWEEINLRRIKAGKSWEQLAKTVDISASGLYNAVNRQTLTIKNFESLCNALNCSPCSFFDCGESGGLVNEPGAHYATKREIEMKTEIDFLRKQLDKLTDKL